ncbi:MAG TPA: S8 family peptidase [Actinophytocola sp.]|uniref:S8 family peptidase n=1 Tax=Actinophytocola sp. TaxID=1872138 RepID=UPI002DDCD256|nr:S8 family peptidase [Actinophytocola sp.]HEV2778792.1 S8 family peptidase [Actinophytocola sp.]
MGDRSFRRIAGLGFAAAAAVATAVGMAAPAAAAEGTILGAGSANAIPGSYIVVFKDGVQAQAQASAARYGGQVKHTYTAALNGYAATMSEQQAKRLAADPAVAYVEQDQVVHATIDQVNPPSWGLDRVDQRDLPLNNLYQYSTTADNVTAYIVDTGIRTTHSNFGGRAVWGTNTTGDGNNTDCNGHGTHVAGTVGGSTFGLAKGVRLVAVKVLTCSGSGSNTGVIAGVDFVTNQHQAGQPAVANMSLGGGASTALDQAVQRSIADGVTYAIASGNSNTSACSSSPARVPEAITVNASTTTDARASFSNFGTCTDIFAPGQGITSAWNTGDSATNNISGTSMATPHVAGAAALVLAGNPSASPSAVATALFNASTPNKITNAGTGSPNRLLFTGSGTPPQPGPCPAASNGTDFPINDFATVNSPITISGCTGAPSASATIEVHIVHTWIGDLVVDLVAPDGTVYNLHNRSGGSADNINQTYTRNLSGETANGTWNLRVRDAAAQDVGRIDSWTLDL